MKRLLTISLVFLMLLGLLAGCGAASKDAMTEGAAPEAAPEAAPMEPMGEEVIFDEAASESDGGGTAMPTDQKLIRTVYMDAETQSMTDLLAWMDGRVAELQGYYEQKSVYRRGSRDDGSFYHSGDFIIRIPAENLDQFVSLVGERANVTSTSETTENVTLTYISTQSRVEALETEQKRLLELLENAENMEDLLTIEKRLTEVRWELENYGSQLRVLDNQVNYSTIHLNIWEVDKPTVVTERTVWQKIGDGIAENTEDMFDGLVNVFIWAVTGLPYLVPVVLIAAVVLVVLKLTVWRKKKVKKTSEEPEEK